jgi:leucyl aminopeptidase
MSSQPTTSRTEALKKLAKQGIKVTTIERAELKRLGMNLIFAVGQASVMPPRVIIMDYNPRGAQKTFSVGRQRARLRQRAA